MRTSFIKLEFVYLLQWASKEI
jgi:cellulase/cellobiase CelA1